MWVGQISSSRVWAAAEQKFAEEQRRERVERRLREQKRRAVLARWGAIMAEGRWSRQEPTKTLPRPPPGPGHAILVEVAKQYGLMAGDLCDKSEDRGIVAIRDEAMYLTQKRTPLSMHQIGAIYNRDHSTVLRGIKRHAERNNLPPARTPRPRGDE